MVQFHLADFVLLCELVKILLNMESLGCPPPAFPSSFVIYKSNKPAFCIFIQVIDKNLKDGSPLNPSLNKYLSSTYDT